MSAAASTTTTTTVKVDAGTQYDTDPKERANGKEVTSKNRFTSWVKGQQNDPRLVTEAWLARCKNEGAMLVSASENDLDDSFKKVCSAHDCEYELDTTGNPHQSYFYFRPGATASKARNPITKAEVWGGPLSHITVVRSAPRNMAGPVGLVDAETGCHVTLRTEMNVQKVPGQKGAATQNDQQRYKTERIPVRPDLIRLHHLARGKWTPSKAKDPKGLTADEVELEKIYRRDSEKFWNDWENTLLQKDDNAKRAKDNRKLALSPEWQTYVVNIETDIMIMMEYWAQVLENISLKW